MRKYLTILICLLPFLTEAQVPTANAGADQTIYLTSTNSVTLTGTATNRSTSLWREVSTDYTSGATIGTPSSLTTTISGLPQGVFYFELAVTSPTDIVAVDTVAVIVNLQTAPGTLLRSLAQNAFPLTSFEDTVNSRTGDTTNTLDQEVYPITFPDGLGNEVFFDRNRKPDEWIDSQHGKFYSRVEDGYDWNNDGYGRAEMSYGSGYNFDTTKTYCMEWKGYFPQAFPSDMTVNQTVATFMQIHANSDAQHVFGTQVVKTSGGAVNFVLDADGSLHTLCGADSFVNKCHTVRVTFKEGVPGAFYKVEVDGVQVYYNNTSVIGGTPRGLDYPKIATLYDYGNALVDPTNSTRGRKFSLVTEDFSIYSISTAAPTANAGSDQSITLPTSSIGVTGTSTNASGTTATYAWTFISGPVTPTITNSTTLTPTISGLTTVGSYVFNLKVSQSDGQTANDQVTITVTEDAPPTVTAGANQTIITTSTTVTSTGTPTVGHIITYLWSDLSSGGTATIVSPTSQNTLINGISVGTHTFQIKVTQDDGQTATATMTVTVTAPPTINAGTNQTYAFGTTFTLTATYTLAPGTTGTFHWLNETDGTGTFSAQTSAVTTVSGLAVGQFRFGCTLTQSDGQTAYDYVIITISTSSTNLNIHRKVIFKNLK